MEGRGHSPSPLPAAAQRERDALPEGGGRSERATSTADPEPGQALWPLRNPGPDASRTCPSSGSRRHPCPPALGSLSAFRAQGPRWLPQLQAPACSQEPGPSAHAGARWPQRSRVAPSDSGNIQDIRLWQTAGIASSPLPLRATGPRAESLTPGTDGLPRIQAPAHLGVRWLQWPQAASVPRPQAAHVTEFHSCSKPRPAAPQRLQPQAASSTTGSREFRELRLSSPGHLPAPAAPGGWLLLSRLSESPLTLASSSPEGPWLQ